MENLVDREAEKILDAFLAYKGPDNLLLLQRAVAAALCRAYEMARPGKTPDIDMDPQSTLPPLDDRSSL